MKILIMIISFLVTTEKFSVAQEYDFSGLEKHFQSYIDDGRLPCASILIIKENNIIYESHLGLQDNESGKHVSANTIFRLASLTKPVTAVAVLTLAENGLIDPDDYLYNYLPEFKNLKFYNSDEEITPVTIRQLLTHTSGMSSGLEQDEVGQLYREMYKKDISSLEDLSNSIAGLPLAEKPGTKFIYSHSSDVLAYLVEKVSGLPFDEYLRENIFKPLEMNSTGFTVDKEEIQNVASLYVIEDSKLSKAGNNEDLTDRITNFPKGNGGLLSTVHDYSNFCLMLLNEGEFNGKQFLKKETVKELRTNQIPEDKLPITIAGVTMSGMGFGYSVGVSVEPNPLGVIPGTFGWIGGSHTQFFIDPVNKIIGIMFSQLGRAQNSKAIPEFNPLVYEALGITN
ncbi:MAG TPA: serine hydrolase domain-containing protein [Ignavibacteria bacterium]|nr:serine hydrolase domain-containing protein [Ignavibacteria bacterium]